MRWEGGRGGDRPAQRPGCRRLGDYEVELDGKKPYNRREEKNLYDEITKHLNQAFKRCARLRKHERLAHMDALS
jgi:hypothetical protein